MSIDEFRAIANDYSRRQEPFLFILDFELQKPLIWKLDSVDKDQVLFDFNGISNSSGKVVTDRLTFRSSPISVADYKSRFDHVMDRLFYGDSFLVNLTVKTPVVAAFDLTDVYQVASARYKLLLQDQFVCFSPETFVQIRDGKIYSYPMKGTIKAEVPNASQVILGDQKEMAEHITIVDLIRNDLSMVASGVTVDRFRYLDRIKTSSGDLLQVSSEISGTLLPEFKHNLGDLLLTLLPAGSISGAPKAKTMEVIRAAEKEDRGYYTGVCGLFDGQTLDSGVIIRYLEKSRDGFYYRSGGGITTQSTCESEYREVIDKIYVPVN